MLAKLLQILCLVILSIFSLGGEGLSSEYWNCQSRSIPTSNQDFTARFGSNRHSCWPFDCPAALARARWRVDVDEAKLDRELGDVLGLDDSLGISVCSEPHEFLDAHKVDVVINSTTSSIRLIVDQIEPFIRAGMDIISSCEELAFPGPGSIDSAKKIDDLAKKHGASVLGTGINPGLMMDTLPIMLTTVCQDVRKVQVFRTVNASERRGALQRKIGAGTSTGAFGRLVEAKQVRRVGMLESLCSIAHALGWELQDSVESVEPIIAERKVKTGFLQVNPGEVAGVR